MKIRLVAFRKATSSATSDTTYNLDLQEAPNISLNFQFSDIKEPEKRKGSFSQTFKLPFTDNNNQFFQDWYNVNLDTLVFDTRTKFNAILYAGGVSQFEGSLQLKAVFQKAQYYQVVLMSNTADLFSVIGNRKLKDVFLNDDGSTSYELNHTFNASNFSKSWDGSATDFYAINSDGSQGASLRDSVASVQKVLYPLSSTIPGSMFFNTDETKFLNMDSGNLDAEFVSPITQFRPAIQIKTLFKLILAKSGFSYTSAFIDHSYFGKLFMTTCNHLTTAAPATIPTLGSIDGAMYVGNSTAWGEVVVNNDDVQVTTPILIPADTIAPISSVYTLPADPSNVWNEQYNYFTKASESMGSVKVSFNVLASNITAASNTSSIAISVILKEYDTVNNTVDWDSNPVSGDIINTTLIDANVNWTASDAQNFSFEIPLDTPNVYVGQSYQIYVQSLGWKRDSSFNPASITFGGAGIAYSGTGGSGTTTFYGLYNSISMNWTSYGTNIYNQVVDIPACIDASITQKAFLKDIIERFNLIILSDPNDANNLIIETFNDYLSTGSIKYWTDKLDTSKEVVVKDTTALQKKEIQFSDLEDVDLMNKSIKEESPLANVYGKINITETNNDFATGILKNNPIFSPFINQKIFVNQDDSIPTQLSNMAVHYEYSYKKVEGGYENTLEETKPKLFFYNGTPTTVYQQYSNNTSVTYYLHQINAGTGAITAHGFTTYPLCSPYDLNASTGGSQLTTTTKSLYWSAAPPICGQLSVFNSINEGITTENSLYYFYWENYLNGIYGTDARIMECHLNLNEVDILNFKFNDEIFIKDSYWRILNIHNYQVAQKVSTKVTLLKVNDSYDSTCYECDYVVASVGENNLWLGYYTWCPSGTPGCTPSLPPNDPTGLFTDTACCECLGGTVIDITPDSSFGLDDSLRPCIANTNSLPIYLQSKRNPLSLLDNNQTKSILSGKIAQLNKPLIIGNDNTKYSSPLLPYMGDDMLIKFANANNSTPSLRGEAHRLVVIGYSTGTTRGYAYPQGKSSINNPIIPIDSNMIIRIKGTSTVVGGTSTDYPTGYTEAFAYYTAFKNVKGTITQLGTTGGVAEFNLADATVRCSLYITYSNGIIQFGLDDAIATTKRMWSLTVDLSVQQLENMSLGWEENWALYQNGQIITLQNYDWLIWN
jgi:hypothetical protein